MFRVQINSVGSKGSRLDCYDTACETHARTLYQKACSPFVALEALLQERVTLSGRTYWTTIKQWHWSQTTEVK